jgi:hypothetical protein
LGVLRKRGFLDYKDRIADFFPVYHVGDGVFTCFDVLFFFCQFGFFEFLFLDEMLFKDSLFFVRAIFRLL